jgi:poly-gamma-glutamate capsule biosynthesis protein CapA/YwtB (metallophosphatase superfamily)
MTYMNPSIHRRDRFKLALITGVLITLQACTSLPGVRPTPAQAITTTESAATGDTTAPSTAITAPTSPAGVDDEIRVSAVGDIMLDGSARPVLQEHGYDYPFANMRALFQDSQVVIGNLEGPLTTRGTAELDKTYTFRSPPDKVSAALKNAGFNVVTLANNHTLDFGPEGLAQTIEALDRAGIQHVGAGADLTAARRAAFVTASGQRIALLGYSVTLPETFYAGHNKAGTAFAHEAQVRADVAAARLQADIVIVSFHWGQEGKTELRDYQTHLGHAAIDAGAQAVLGHHPHILQAIEYYKDGVILYSLGNFTFGSYSKTAAASAVAQLTFRHGRLASLRMIPIMVDNFEVQFQPRVLSGADADAVVTTLQDLSELQHTTLLNMAGVAQLQLPQATARAE